MGKSLEKKTVLGPSIFIKTLSINKPHTSPQKLAAAWMNLESQILANVVLNVVFLTNTHSVQKRTSTRTVMRMNTNLCNEKFKKNGFSVNEGVNPSHRLVKSEAMILAKK